MGSSLTRMGNAIGWFQNPDIFRLVSWVKRPRFSLDFSLSIDSNGFYLLCKLYINHQYRLRKHLEGLDCKSLDVQEHSGRFA